MKPAFIDDLTEKLCILLPESLQGLKEDTQQNVKAILQAGFERMQLVTQEEFDVQKKILARTRERVEQLEQQLKQLEDAVHANSET